MEFGIILVLSAVTLSYAHPDELSPAVLSSATGTRKLEATSVFTIFGGTGCQVEEGCLVSHRRRRYDVNAHCDVSISPDAGSLVFESYSITDWCSLSFFNLSTYPLAQWREPGFTSCFYAWCITAKENSWASVGYVVEPVDYLRWRTRQSDKANGQYAGWKLCPMGSKVGPPQIPSREAMEAPFEAIGGCYVSGRCLLSHRRRGDPYYRGDWCSAQVGHGVGPLSVPEFETVQDSDKLVVNGVEFSGSHGPEGIRPMGAIFWSTNDGWRQGWTICAPLPYNATSSISTVTTTAEPVLEVHSVRSVWNGVDGVFDVLSNETAKMVARLACESHYGEDSCTEGSCRCFRYFYRAGAVSCNCDKAKDEYEWVFGNDWCHGVSEDYSPVDWNETGGILLDTNHYTFVRRRATGCGIGAWELVAAAIGVGINLPHHHVVLDLRASSYSHESIDLAWPNLVPNGPSGVLNDPFFVPEEQSFIFGGSIEGADPSFASVNLPYWPMLTLSAWVKFPDPGSQYSGTAVHPLSTSAGFGLMTLQLTTERANSWLHLVAVWNHNRVTQFLNGQPLDAEVLGSGSRPTAADTMLIGRLPGAAVALAGIPIVEISDVAIFDRTMTKREVGKLFVQGRPSAGNARGPTRRCRYTGGYESLGEILAATTTTSTWLASAATVTWQAFTATGGGCRVMRGCVENIRRRRGKSAHVNDVQCTVTVNYLNETVLFSAPQFNLGGEILKFKSNAGPEYNFTGSYGPDGSEQPESIVWKEPVDAKTQWRICAHLRPDANTTALHKANSYLDCLLNNGEDPEQRFFESMLGTSTSCSVLANSTYCEAEVVGSYKFHRICPLSCNATSRSTPQLQTEQSEPEEIDDTPVWTVRSGLCQVHHHSCVSSPLYPLTVEGNQSCLLEAPSALLTSVDIHRDDHGNQSFQVFDGTAWALLTPGESNFPASSILWSSSNTPTNAWMICAKAAGTTTGDTCANDESWTDALYGDGSKSCSYFASHTAWCFLRGLYSVEAINACPQACGTCSGGFHQLDGQSCGEATRLDESQAADHIATAEACFRHCLALEPCTHFQWQAGVACSRFRGCSPQAAGSVAASSIPGKARSYDGPLITGLTWDGLAGWRYSGKCTVHLDEAGCRRAAQIAEMAYVDMDLDEKLVTAPSCAFSKQAGEFFMRDSAGLECSLLYPCICSEWATESLPLAKRVPARSTPAIPATRKGMLLAVEKEARNETFEDCPQVHDKSCLGKRREFRQFRVPHLLGPKLHPFPADWDGDGDMDLLLGRWSGELVYMENVGGELDFAAARGLSRTAAGTSCVQTWQYPSESKNCGHWCCYYQALGDVCLNGKDSWVTCSPASAWGVTTGDALVPTAVDMDDDGDLDLLVASCDGTLQYWIRNGVHNLTRVLDPAANPFEGLLANRESACFFPDVVDWDHDGDLDVLMGTTTGRIEMFENRDGKFHHMLDRENEDPFRKIVMEGLAVPCAVDWDDDGDLDLLVGSTSGDVQVFYRTEFGVLTAAGRVPGVQVEGNSVPRAADWDGDGTLDLFVVDGESGELTIWISTMVEADKLVEETGIFNPFTDLPLGHLPKPQVVDFDGNGRLDLFIVDDDSKPKYFPSFDEFFVRSANTTVNTLLGGWDSVSTQHVTDWDLDGDYDLLLGQNGGGVFWHEYDNATDSFAPRQLLFSDGAAVGAYSVHAVDWDNDGDQDLVVGASGVDVPRRLRMTGLPLPEWNGWYREQGPTMIIGGHGVFISDTNEWVLALCSTGRYWYLFQNSEAVLQANRADACQGAVAKMPVDRSLLDRGLVGEQNLWQAQGAIGKYIQSYEQYVTSDGTERSPHCHVCSEAQKANGCGGCNVSEGVQHNCAVEICKRWGFDSAEVAKFRPEPIEQCSCANTDPEHVFDLFGKKCGVYSPEWCGNYNTMNFSSQQMCCTCGGGYHGDGSNIQHWVVQAKCFHEIQPWTPVPKATVAELLPGPEEFSQSALRYFERTAPASLVERLGDANPFKAVEMFPGSRVYPDVVDWNGDGRNDLILGSYSREFFSFTTDGTQERPHCGASTATWDRSMKQQCATAICRMAGFSRGSVTDGSLSSAPTSGLAFSLASGSLEEVAKVASAVQLAARCAQGGFVRYFQQQENGTMEEKLEDANPFSVLSDGFPSRSAVVQPLHFDADDKLDVVFADDQGMLRFFTLGQTCQRSQSCSSKGVCDPVLRRCTCASGHTNNDCSQCMEGYFSFHALKADVSSCQECPGFGTDDGICAGRGTCNDDITAQRAFLADSSSTGSITAVSGNGSCSCNTYFYGTDHRRLTSCTEGMCPAGFEFKDKEDGLTKNCSQCKEGFIKSAPGDGECTECEAGRFSDERGATKCKDCPAGEYQDEAGKSKCIRCAQREFSTGGAASCSTCPVGKYAGEEGMSECAQCPPGKWSSQTGSDRCEDCPEGKYGTGLEPCSQCVKGSYSKVPPRTTCAFCPQGRYSEVIEGASIDVCQPCSIGKFSGAVGASRMESCTACENGATTAAEASVSKQRCVQPDRGNFSCVAGRHCAVHLEGNELRSPHQLAFWDAQLLVHSSDKTENGTHYDWQGNVVVEGGTYKLSWCPGLITNKHAACNGIPDFAFEVGLLDVIGPQRTSFKCVRGRSCEHLGPVRGLGLLASDLLQLQTSCSSGDPVPITGASSSWLATGMALDTTGALTFGFGPDFVSVNPSERGYEVCWCATGRGQLGGCADSGDFHVLVGSLTIQGPLTGQEMVCYLGQECRLTGIQGIEMAVGDRLMVLDRCGRQGQPPKGVPSGGIAETNGMIMSGGMDFDFFLPLGSFNRTTEVLQSIPGLYRLCYCRPKAGGCESAADFNASTGFFRAKGPYNDHSIGCFVGSTCALENMRGIGLGDRDGVEIQLGDGACGSTTYVDEHPAGFQAFRVLAQNRGQDFSFGALPATATPGRYRLCWRSGTSSQGPFLANVGLLHVACPGGAYRLVIADRASCETCPQGFYCPGGSDGGNWVDDKLLACKPGSTTVGTSSTGPADCVCREGFRLDAGACIPCGKGEYKAVIANDAACMLCPNGTTSLKGASSAGQCFSEELTEETGNSSQSNAEVFVVEGVLQFPACMDDNLLSKAQVQLKQVLSDSMRVDKDEVKIVLGPEPASCHSFNASARRLQQAFRNVSYSVSLASQREAERLSKSINPAAIQANLQETVGIRVEVFTDPFIAKQLLNCTLRGAGYSFPLGSQPTSTDDCECAVGYGKPDADTDSCVLCGIGLHKKHIGAEQCSPCGTVPGHDGSQLRLTTKKRGATGEQFCTCLKGYFAPPNSTTPPGTCNLCGIGYYCEGGSARQQCPPGETTTISKAVAVTDCVCVAGLTRGQLRNGTFPCEPCPKEKFKAEDSDEPCSQDCPANSEAKPGSTSRRDCFCKSGYYHENSTDTCRACPADGVLCPGGFDPPGSFVHAAPKAKAGYFMTGYALAERCFIVDSAGESVCLAGATASNQTNACGGLQTGDLCGACKHLSARDLGDEPCEPCEESYADWMHVINLNVDLILKAGFGIFLGSRSLTSPTGAKRMEAVIFRILLQWITASSVLGTFDLASVRLFDWSTEDQTDAAVEGENEDVALLTAEGLSFKFRFPEWFQPVWRSLMAITGTIPGPVSPQISLECLIQKQMSATQRSGGQLLGPPLWWLLYPLLVMVWVAILCLVLAKMVFPFAARFTEKAKRGLSSRLTAVGVSSASSQRALETMTAARVQQILQDPDVMADDGSLLEAFGGEVYIEAASQVLVEQTGPQFLNMLQQLVNDSLADEHATACAQEVLSGGLEFLGTFVTRVVKLMRSHNKDLLCNVFSDPHSVLPVVKTFIEEKGIKSTDDAGAARQSQSPRESSTKSSRGSTDAGAVFPVFGLFRDTAAANVLRDALPLYLVTMYSIWDLVTRRMLGLLQARTIKVGADATLQGRWLYDMRFSVFRAEHIPVCVVSLVGLTVWSLAFLVTLFVVLKRGKHFLQEQNFVRKFGYFYNGLEPNMFWWEVVLKKGDILLLYIVTFTELFHDPKAKLIMYLGFAGFFWAAHNMYHPYDDRQNKLADRLEDFGLMTRFVTVFLLQILIMVSRHRQMNAIMAIAIVVFNVRFLCVIGFVLAVELPNTDTRISLRSKQSSMDSGFVARCTRILTLAFKYTVGLLGNMILRAFSVLARSKQLAAKKVPHIMWQGPGLDLIVVTHEAERLPWHERLFTIFVSYLYKLGEHDQKTYVANSLAQFWEYIMNNSNCHHLPACIMDIFFVLPTALKKERAQIHTDVDMAPLHLRVAKRVHDILMEHHQQRISEVVQAQRTRATSAWSGADGSESQRLGASEHLDAGIASRESGKAEKVRTSSGEGSESTRLGASTSLENLPSTRATSRAEKVRTSSDFSLTEASQSQRLGGSVSLENGTAIRATSRDRARSRSSSAAGAYARSIGSSQRDMGRGKSFSVSEGLPDHVHSGEDFNASLLFVQCLSRNEVHDFIVEASIDEETSNMGKQTSI